MCRFFLWGDLVGETYKTVQIKTEAEFTEKRSRFIGAIAPVSYEAQAQAFIEEIRRRHRDARHNVFAYRLREGGIKRYSDDGEPQGTAGVPVLNVLEKADVFDAVIVVTRYFGGILLGGGGLVRAYSHTAHLALTAGKIVTLEKQTVFRAKVDYAFHGKLLNLLEGFGAKVIKTAFEQNVTLEIVLPSEVADQLDAKVFDLSAGAVKLEKIGEKFAEK